MNDETPSKDDHAASRAGGEADSPHPEASPRHLPEPLDAAGFSLQDRVIWPLQDRFTLLPGSNRTAAWLGGGAAVAAVAVAAAIALSSGGGSSAPTTTVSEAPLPTAPAVTSPAPTQPKPKKQEPPPETLHGAKPVFSPPSPATKGGVKAGASKSQAGKQRHAAESSSGAATSASESSGTSSPASARISSDPKKKAQEPDGATTSSAAAVPNGPPAPAAALKVAREFARGFVAYEIGGEAASFRTAFKASATPELTKALLQRPPKQPAGVRVPKAKVLNVVAGPSQGRVYKVSVSLLRVGVTSELRLEMEDVKASGKTAGKSAKRAEWRVTNVLG
ncbi:MAG: hypothetical protein JST31_10955 [Actinobacteria bacterium]|nr:hypothetical protein [Actinomycetota bacterium]